MATKAERFRHDVERSGAPRPKTAAKKARAAVRRPSKGRKAVFEFEEVKPHERSSRKSTRRSKNHQKAATPLKAKKTLVQTAPHSRHEQGRRAPRAAH
jgi:hypothetical protein